MNAIGCIGEFIIKYQNTIDISLLLVLALIVLAVLARGLVRMVRRKYVLNEISKTINQISDAVETIERQQEELKADVKQLKNGDNIDYHSIDLNHCGEAETQGQASNRPEIEIEAGSGEQPKDTNYVGNEKQQIVGTTYKQENKNQEKDSHGVSREDVQLLRGENFSTVSDIFNANDNCLKVERTLQNDENEKGLQQIAHAGEVRADGRAENDASYGTDIIGTSKKQADVDMVKPVKYINRECNVDKQGRVYTEEELRAQIR